MTESKHQNNLYHRSLFTQVCKLATWYYLVAVLGTTRQRYLYSLGPLGCIACIADLKKERGCCNIIMCLCIVAYKANDDDHNQDWTSR